MRLRPNPFVSTCSVCGESKELAIGIPDFENGPSADEDPPVCIDCASAIEDERNSELEQVHLLVASRTITEEEAFRLLYR